MNLQKVKKRKIGKANLGFSTLIMPKKPPGLVLKDPTTAKPTATTTPLKSALRRKTNGFVTVNPSTTANQADESSSTKPAQPTSNTELVETKPVSLTAEPPAVLSEGPAEPEPTTPSTSEVQTPIIKHDITTLPTSPSKSDFDQSAKSHSLSIPVEHKVDKVLVSHGVEVDPSPTPQEVKVLETDLAENRKTDEQFALLFGDLRKYTSAEPEDGKKPRIVVEGRQYKFVVGVLGDQCLKKVNVAGDEVVLDRHDARCRLDPFDANAVCKFAQKMDTERAENDKLWEGDALWHLQKEKLLLVKEGAGISIQMLEEERYLDLRRFEMEQAEAEEEAKRIPPVSIERRRKRRRRSTSPTNHIVEHVIIPKNHLAKPRPPPRQHEEEIPLPPGLQESFVSTFVVPHHITKPKTKKQHELVLKTAEYIRKNGLKAEIELQVKQANNPVFSFLFEHGTLHDYFEFLKRGEHEMSRRERFLKKSKEIQKQLDEKRRLSEGNHGKTSLGLAMYADSSSEDEQPPQEEKQKPRPLTGHIKCDTFEGHVPPSQIKQIVKKLAVRVAHFGRVFEEKVKKQKNDDPSFVFLQSFNKYHSYYLWVLDKAVKSVAATKARKKAQKVEKSVAAQTTKETTERKTTSSKEPSSARKRSSRRERSRSRTERTKKRKSRRRYSSSSSLSSSSSSSRRKKKKKKKKKRRR